MTQTLVQFPLFAKEYGTTKDVYKRSLNSKYMGESTYVMLEKALSQTVEEKKKEMMNMLSRWKAETGISPQVEEQLRLIIADTELMEKITLFYDGSFMNTGLRVRQNSIYFGYIRWETAERIKQMENYSHYDMDLIKYLHELGEEEVERIKTLSIYEQMKLFAPMYEGFFVQLSTERDYDSSEVVYIENKVNKHKREVYFNAFDKKANKRVSVLKAKDRDLRYAINMSDLKKHGIIRQYAKQINREDSYNPFDYMILPLADNELFMSKIFFTDHSEYDFCIEALGNNSLEFKLNFNSIGENKLVEFINKETGLDKEAIRNNLSRGFFTEQIMLLIEYVDYIPFNIGYKPVSKH